MGDELVPSVHILSNTVANGRRTVKLTRALIGATPEHYTFNPQKDTMHLITAVGKSQAFGYHDHHGPSQISLAAVGSAMCVCDAGSSGKLCQTNGTHCAEFTQNCFSEAKGGDLLEQRNPTCNSRQYSGGLKCCGHRRIMLDVDQAEESRQRALLRYHMKIRIWYQELTKDASGTPSHYNLDRIYYQTEAN